VSSRVAAALAAVALVVGLAAAMSVDVVKTGFGLKGDEATYVAIGLSAAFDGDLTYERRDLERFFGLYRSGPEGIFLKRGKQLRVRVDATPPFVHRATSPDRRSDRLYFGKALLYGVAAAPFVRLFGLNGFLVFHVLLLVGAAVCLYRFLAARSEPGASLLFTTAFIGASCVFVYVVFLAPEILNFSLVVFAYFCWLYKEVAESEGPGLHTPWLLRPSSTAVGAALLGAVTYSNPRHALLIAPVVLYALWRRRFVESVMAAAAFGAVAGMLYTATALNTGEFNYQGGDRKTFYSKFPFDGSSQGVWTSEAAKEMSTNDADTGTVFTDFTNRFTHNVEYFLIGRHFGFIPYFFPGAIAIVLWLASRDRWLPWKILTFLAVAGSAIALLVFAPFTWSGGGGPPGNRYFMSIYAATFFLTPPVTTMIPGLVAWTGGALFTAKMLLNPFVAVKSPNQTTERGFARRLPVEVTMANDLPIMLEGARAHAWFSDVLLYFLDEHAYSPETIDADGNRGVWISGSGRADILVRCEWPIDRLVLSVSSPIRTVFTASMGSTESRVELEPNKPATIDVPAAGIRDLNSYAYLLRARSTEGFTEHLRDPASTDYRNLGVLMRFKAIPKQAAR